MPCSQSSVEALGSWALSAVSAVVLERVMAAVVEAEDVTVFGNT